MITQIATAAEEQSHVAEEMNKNIIMISTEASHTSQSGTETLEATAEIGTMIESLRGQASQFKVDDETIEIAQAKTAHLAWRGRLRAFLDGKSSLTRGQATDHHNCSFGQWYQNKGVVKFGHIPEIKEINQPHAELHAVIKKVIEYKESGRLDDAEHEYEKIESLSRQVVSLLEVIGQKLK